MQELHSTHKRDDEQLCHLQNMEIMTHIKLHICACLLLHFGCTGSCCTPRLLLLLLKVMTLSQPGHTVSNSKRPMSQELHLLVCSPARAMLQYKSSTLSHLVQPYWVDQQ
jgi:hypothetical protein